MSAANVLANGDNFRTLLGTEDGSFVAGMFKPLLELLQFHAEIADVVVGLDHDTDHTVPDTFNARKISDVFQSRHLIPPIWNGIICDGNGTVNSFHAGNHKSWGIA